MDGVNEFTCDCDVGYHGRLCQTDVDDCAALPCVNGGTCEDGVGAFTCACAPGFTGNRCESDLDECESEPCENGGICVDRIDMYVCSCMAGYEGQYMIVFFSENITPKESQGVISGINPTTGVNSR